MNTKKNLKRRASAPGILSSAMAKVYETNRNEEARLGFDIAELGRKHHLNNIRHYTEVRAIAKELSKLELQKDQLKNTFSKEDLKSDHVQFIAWKKINIQRKELAKRRESAKRRKSFGVDSLRKLTETTETGNSNQNSLLPIKSANSEMIISPEIKEGSFKRERDESSLPPIVQSDRGGSGHPRPSVLRRHSAFPRMVSDTGPLESKGRFASDTVPSRHTGRVSAPPLSGIRYADKKFLTPQDDDSEVIGKQVNVQIDDVSDDESQGADSAQSPRRLRLIKGKLARKDTLLQEKICDFLRSEFPGEERNIEK